MTAGGDYNITLIFVKHSFILVFNNCCTNCSFFNFIKAKLLKCVTHCVNSHTFVICNKRWCQAYNNGIAALQKHLYFFGFINNLFCILRTNNKTLSAQNTFISDNMCLISRKTD